MLNRARVLAFLRHSFDFYGLETDGASLDENALISEEMTDDFVKTILGVRGGPTGDFTQDFLF